jgi:hypothetical protein
MTKGTLKKIERERERERERKIFPVSVIISFFFMSYMLLCTMYNK